MKENIDIVLAKTGMARVESYMQELRYGTGMPGSKLAAYCGALGQDPFTMEPEALLQALLRTKEPVLFAESQAKLDGSDWTPIEYEILSSVGMVYEVETYDNGVWGKFGDWSKLKQYTEPFKQLALIISAPLLTKNSPDYKRIVKNGRIDYDDYYEVMEERLLPLLVRASKRASADNTLVIALPGLGCGAFSGEFRGTGQVERNLIRCLNEMFKTHHALLGNIDTIVLDMFEKCKLEDHKYGNLKFRVRSGKAGVEGKKSLPQLSAAIEYAEEGDDFTNCRKGKGVAGDGCSLSGNDANMLSRDTDEGAFGSGTNSASVVTGVDGGYQTGDGSHTRPPLYTSDQGPWIAIMNEKRNELLPITEETLHVVDIPQVIRVREVIEPSSLSKSDIARMLMIAIAAGGVTHYISTQLSPNSSISALGTHFDIGVSIAAAGVSAILAYKYFSKDDGGKGLE